jgi:alkanesulfonate monooxygenase SsuD/methylene tetrahydromethanopterin reductase-like flavin-dependent oxidoreductase (luciferase family)
MTLIGYTMMCEQAGPKQLVRDVALAEEAGFDFAVISDPWRWTCTLTSSQED